MWDILMWAVVGLLAGGLAKLLKPGAQGGGCLVTIILGIVGALLGGFIAREVLGMEIADGSISFKSILVATGGALLVLVIYGAVTKKR